MLNIKGIQKLLSVNPRLRGIEEFKDRYRLHTLVEGSHLPLLFDVFKVPSESNDIILRLHSSVDGDVFGYNTFPMACSLQTFSDLDTFNRFFDIIIQTWVRGGLSGSRSDVNRIRPKGERINSW